MNIRCPTWFWGIQSSHNPSILPLLPLRCFFFYVMRRVKNSLEDWLNLTRFRNFSALHWKGDVSRKEVFQFILEMSYRWLIKYWCISCVSILALFNSKAVAPSNWSQKRRGRDALMLSCLIYFFAPFLVYQIPHIYVISQAMPHAIPKTHSSFYPHHM